MTRSCYLASKFARHAELSGYADQLRELGIDVTARWLDSHGGPDGSLEHPDMPRFALEDVEDVKRADTIVSFTAGGGGRGGRHVEFGIGVAAGLRLIVVGPREHVFHTLPQVEQYDLWAQAVDAMLMQGERPVTAPKPRVQVTEWPDELEPHIAERLRDPVFATAYEDEQEKHRAIDALVAARRAAGLTQAEVARRMGVTQPTVSQFEVEGSDPRLSTLARYARAVGCQANVVVEARRG